MKRGKFGEKDNEFNAVKFGVSAGRTSKLSV